jgi:hypothetical protein
VLSYLVKGFLIPVLIICTVANMGSTKYELKKQKKSAITSGIILTLAGLIYSTFQTQFIIKRIGNQIKDKI